MLAHHRRLVFVLPLLLAACGMRPAEKGLVGTWELDKEALRNSIRAEIDKDPRAANPQARAFIDAMLAQFDNVTATIELKGDRTYHAAGKGLGRDDANDGTWRLEGNEVVLESNLKNGEPMRLTKVSSTLLKFEKEQRGRKVAIELRKTSGSGTPAAPR